MSFQLMKQRIQQSGYSLYDEQLKDAQDILAYGFQDDISYNPNIVIYNTCKSIPIKIYDKKYSASYGITAKFLAMHNIKIELGELLHDTCKNEYWLCVESFNVSGIHNEGKLGKCHRFLKWQDKNGIIRETPAIITTASKYNNGENGTEVIYTGSDQLMIYIKLDENTVKLDRGIRFLIDENKINPTVYEITRADTVLNTYMGKGFISIIVKESLYMPTEKEIELSVCNYVDMNEPSTSPLPDNPNETIDLTAQISGNVNLKVGVQCIYTVDFTDKTGEGTSWKDIEFSWNIVSDFYIEERKDNNWIKLMIDDDSLIGGSFLLQILVDSTVIGEKEISIVDIV